MLCHYFSCKRLHGYLRNEINFRLGFHSEWAYISYEEAYLGRLSEGKRASQNSERPERGDDRNDHVLVLRKSAKVKHANSIRESSVEIEHKNNPMRTYENKLRLISF